MAFCSNCGAQVADGAAFCDSCGARLAGGYADAPAPRRSAPAYNGPAYSSPAPKKGKTGLVIGLAALLVVALVIGVLFLTGVFGGAKGIEGTWVATRTEDGYPARLVLVLEKGGEGYAYQEKNGEKYFFFPLTWDEATIYADGDPVSYTLDGDSLTAFDGEGSFVFTRGQDDDSAGSSTLQPGRYRLTAIYGNGVDYSSDIAYYYGEVILQLSETHTGSMTMGGDYEEIPMWDRHFIRYGSHDRFYRCDGSQFTMYIYGEEWVFTREG
jgi:hypothetical protein